MTAGERLRSCREALGLTIRDVEGASARIAERHNNPDYALSLSRVSDIETKGIVPSIHKLYSMAAIYGRSLCEVLAYFGIDSNAILDDCAIVQGAKTRVVNSGADVQSVQMPTAMDPGFDPESTTILGRMIMKWGAVPMAYLQRFTERKFTYAYIGTDDHMMYPLILPGAFVQIDESDTKIAEGPWRSEYERPIYLVELRSGFVCCWCEVTGTDLILKPHPMSPEKTKVVRFGRGAEADIIGRVVGIAMRLDGRRHE